MTLDDLAALARAATPGPWTERGRDVRHDRLVAEGRNPADSLGLGCEVDGPPEAGLRGRFERHADARYIAACSPEVIAALVSVAQAAEAVAGAYSTDPDSPGVYDPLTPMKAALATLEDR